jgi:hypothetical protein
VRRARYETGGWPLLERRSGALTSMMAPIASVDTQTAN